MQSVRNLSIRSKLYAGFGVVLALSIVIGIVLVAQLASVNAGGVYIATNSLPSIQVIDAIEYREADYRDSQLGNVSNSAVAASSAFISRIHADRIVIADDFHRYLSMISNDRDAHLRKLALAQWDAYVQATPRLDLASSNTGQPQTVSAINRSAGQFVSLSSGECPRICVGTNERDVHAFNPGDFRCASEGF